MLTDPRPALAEQSSFVGYLLGLSALGRMVPALISGTDPRPADRPGEADDLVYLLLGLVRLGRGIEGLAPPGATAAQPRHDPMARPSPSDTRWLR